jgi:hypothetical protein
MRKLADWFRISSMIYIAKRQTALALGVLLLLAQMLSTQIVFADRLTSARVNISNSTAGIDVSQEFEFTIPSFSNLGSIKFEYCDSPLPAVACVTPTGVSASGASLTDQSGEIGFSILPGSPSNEIILTRSTTPASGSTASYEFDNITNPTQPNTPVYVRIHTFESEDATGSSTDFGVVAFSTARNLAVSGYVPPYLIFCTGVTVSLNCTSTNGSQLNFGELGPSRTGALTSQYSGSTNDPGGFNTSVHGNTMTSGTNFIPAMQTPQFSQQGQAQFGLNLRDNSSPDVGAEKTGPGTSVPVGAAANVNQFFLADAIISNSVKSTDFNRFTVSYIVNVPSNQAPGVYSSTLTYIAVAAF